MIIFGNFEMGAWTADSQAPNSIVSPPKGLHLSRLSGACTSPSLLLTGRFPEPHCLTNVIENHPNCWPSNLRSEQVKAQGDV